MRRLIATSAMSVLAFVSACETAELTLPVECRGETCTCEQDPYQLRCRGFAPDGSYLEPTPDAGVIDGSSDAPDEADASASDADVEGG